MADRVPDSRSQEERVDAVILHYLEEVDAGRRPDHAAILAGHPDLANELLAFFADEQHAGALGRPLQKLRAPLDHLAETLDETRSADIADSPPPLKIGGYRPLRLLGAGGMGRVYEAEDATGRRVALKLISPGFASSHMALERFRREGRLAGMISHPRCVFVLAADEEDGQPYIVMELMSGSTLKDLIDRQGPLAPHDAVIKILDVIEGLQEAHQAGVLHRDVKPSNCYLDAEGRVKVGDFGLSRSLGKRVQLTQVGAFVGTPLFASPEQLKGEELDARTDVYSVAATLYYLLTGQAPFQHTDAATVIARVVTEPPPSPRQFRPDVPAALEQVVLRGLERQRERRIQNLDEFREALLPLLPEHLTIAAVGLRIGAYILDGTPFWIAGEVFAVWNFQLTTAPNLLGNLAVNLLFFLYLWLAEGLWGQSLGKWLVGLRVTRVTGPEPPGLGRGGVRIAVLMLLYGLLAHFIVWLLLDAPDRVTWAIYQGIGEVIGLVVCFGMIRSRNGYRGLHELLSGTRTVRLPQGHATRLILEDVPAESAARPEDCPRQVGPFRITGLAQEQDAERLLLLGEDAGLGRQVWVWRRPASAPAVAPIRRDVARSTRLRWLAGGENDGKRWDAFMAPAGQRLVEVIRRQGPIDWPVARGILEQLAEELAAGVADGTLTVPLSVEQLWLHKSGRVQLTDWPGGPAGPVDGGDAMALVHWRQTAAILLEDAAAMEGSQAPIRAPVPMHARLILDRSDGTRQPYERIAQVRDAMLETRTRPTHVTLGLRALQMALASIFVVIGLSHMFIWGRMAAIADYVAADHAMVHAEALALILEDDALRTALRAKRPAGHELQGDPASLIAVLRARVVVDRHERDAELPGLGPMGVFVIGAVRQGILDSDRPLRVEREPGHPFRVRVLPATGAVVEVRPLELEKFDGILAHARGAENPEKEVMRRAFGISAVFMVALFPAIWVAWAFLFRGGISLRVAGLALVRSSGRPALRVQCAWRALVLWAPIVAVLLLVVWLDANQLGNVMLCTSLQGLAALVLVAQAALTLRFPRRAPHDWLAGVHVVPR